MTSAVQTARWGNEIFPNCRSMVAVATIGAKGSGKAPAALSTYKDWSIGSPVIVSAGRSMNQELVGKWTEQHVRVPEGQAIRIKADVTRYGARVPTAGMVIAVARNHGPLVRLKVMLSGFHGATYQELVALEGRMDVLSLEEANQRFTLTAVDARLYGTGIISVEELAPEVMGKPVEVVETVRLEDGSETTVGDTVRKRMLDL